MLIPACPADPRRITSPFLRSLRPTKNKPTGLCYKVVEARYSVPAGTSEVSVTRECWANGTPEGNVIYTVSPCMTGMTDGARAHALAASYAAERWAR